MAYSIINRYKLYIDSADGWSGSPTMSESPNLYLEIEVGDLEVQRTKVIERNNAPIWNQELIISGQISCIISMTIKHKSGLPSGDPCVGRVEIPVDALLSACEDGVSAILRVEPNTTQGHGWSMASITVKLTRVTYSVVHNTSRMSRNITHRILPDTDPGVKPNIVGNPGSQSHLLRNISYLRCPGRGVAGLDKDISDMRNAIELAADVSNQIPYRCALYIAQMERYDRLGELIDLNDSISNLKEVVGLLEGHPDKLHYMSRLGLCQRRRYEALRELGDAEDSIANIQPAVQFTEDGHLDKPAYLGSLGMSQLMRYNSSGKVTDVEDSISNLQKAIQWIWDGDPDLSMYLDSLGVSQRARYACLGELRDLEDSISTLQKAVRITKEEYPMFPVYVRNLGLSQRRRHEALGELTDLEGSISNFKKALQFINDENPSKPVYLTNLGDSQILRFRRLGALTDLDNSILNLQRAVQLGKDGDPDRSFCLAGLGRSQGTRYKYLGELADIEDSISNFQKAVQFTMDGDPDKPSHLANLGISLGSRFSHLGELADIRDSISNLQKAVQFTEDRHSDKATYLSSLGTSQRTRFECLGELTDLVDSVMNLQMAVQLCEDGRSNKQRYLGELGFSQMRLYERLGKLTDVEDSIFNLQRAVQFTEVGHQSRAEALSKLGACQAKRYERLGELTDIENSILNLRQAVQLTEDGHPNKPVHQLNLSGSQMARYVHLNELVDVEDSIFNLQKAVQFVDDDHLDKPAYLYGLGHSQLMRYYHLGELVDIESSIVNYRKAVQLIKDGHIEKPRCLCGLALCLKARYNCLNQLHDLEDSICHFDKAVQLTDEDHPDKAHRLCGLGTAKGLRFDRLKKPEDAVTSILALRAAAQSKTARPGYALLAAQYWANRSNRNGDVWSALEGYRTALEILPKVAWLGLNTEARQAWLSHEDAENLSCLAATCAIRQGCLEEAVELLDSGRSVIWQQASSLRVESEKLKEINPELAEQFERVGQKLDAGNFSGSSLRFEQNGGINADGVGRERRRLVGEWEDLLERVRQLPQFEHFLKPVPFSQLCQAAIGGQIIIINASAHGVDALVFDAVHQIEHVPLPDVNLETLKELGRDIVLQRHGNASVVHRRAYTNRYLKPALRNIWNDIMIPIFNKIHVPLNGNFSDAPQRRIWWYPTGPLTFIPIHASGPGKDDIDASCLVISSYVTTLNSFFQAQKKTRQTVVSHPKLLALSQPETPGQQPLPLALDEVEKVVEVVSSAGWLKEDIVRLSASDASVDRVSEALDSCPWVHFACHGMQHPTSGMNSAFALQNGNLELSQIASKRLSTGQFAFLSACHTAAGLQGLPGEAMHLAGGLQFAGFPSVIATMWDISDDDAPIVARFTYEHLLRNGLQGCDPSEAAMALNHAVRRLREDPHVTVDRWAPFIHFGI